MEQATFRPGHLVFIAPDRGAALPLDAFRPVAAWPAVPPENMSDLLKSIIELEVGTPVIFLGYDEERMEVERRGWRLWARERSLIGWSKILYGERIYTIPSDRIQSEISTGYDTQVDK